MNKRKQSVREWAQEAGSAKRAQGFHFIDVHEYVDADGVPVYWKLRYKNPATGKKWIRPIRQSNDGSFEMGLPDFPVGRPVYRLRDLATRTGEPVLVCEGEGCADLLAGLGLLATTSGDCQSARGTSWDALTGRDVIIWPDNDAPGARYASEVAAVLRGRAARLRFVDVACLGLPSGGDAVDWHAANKTVDRESVLRLAMTDDSDLAAVTPVERTERCSIAVATDMQVDDTAVSMLVRFVEERCELFHDRNKEVYARVESSGATHSLDGRSFKNWLVATHYLETGAAAREHTFREALATLGGIGRHRDCHDVHVRVAQDGADYYLDLCEDDSSRAVRIAAGHWEVVDQPPVYFLRPSSAQPLPVPRRGGNIDLLWGLINIPESAKLRVLAWLVDCLRPDTPFPLLELVGGQGAAKSTTQEILRRLFDPNDCNLRGSPRNEEDVYISAKQNWCVSYENISTLTPAIQDALCVIATGGGHAKRRLYSDGDEVVIKVKRPIVINGIAHAVTAQDLVERTVAVDMPPIDTFVERRDLVQRFDAIHGELLGGLLDAMAAALAHLPNVALRSNERARLIEFVKLGIALAEVTDRTRADFMSEFRAGRLESVARALDESPVATALIQWFDRRGRVAVERIAVKELSEAIAQECPIRSLWPPTSRAFANALRRAQVGLQEVGIECREEGKVGGHVRLTIRECSPSMP